jgi:hypothetical protein
MTYMGTIGRGAANQINFRLGLALTGHVGTGGGIRHTVLDCRFCIRCRHNEKTRRCIAPPSRRIPCRVGEKVPGSCLSYVRDFVSPVPDDS